MYGYITKWNPAVEEQESPLTSMLYDEDMTDEQRESFEKQTRMFAPPPFGKGIRPSEGKNRK